MEREEAARQAAKREAEAKRVRAMATRVAAEAEAEGRRKAAASPPKLRSKQQQVIEEARRLAEEEAKRIAEGRARRRHEGYLQAATGGTAAPVNSITRAGRPPPPLPS